MYKSDNNQAKTLDDLTILELMDGFGGDFTATDDEGNTWDIFGHEDPYGAKTFYATRYEEDEDGLMMPVEESERLLTFGENGICAPYTTDTNTEWIPTDCWRKAGDGWGSDDVAKVLEELDRTQASVDGYDPEQFRFCTGVYLYDIRRIGCDGKDYPQWNFCDTGEEIISFV